MTQTRSLLVGPANYAGQADEYAKALRTYGGVAARSLAVQAPRQAVSFPADVSVPALRWLFDPLWKRRLRAELVREVDAVLLDGALPLFSAALRLHAGRPTIDHRRVRRDVAVLRRAGKQVGLLFHGSEIRDPDRHAAWEPLSPYRSMAPAALEGFRRIAAESRETAEATGAEVFLTTPDLLLDFPAGRWTPTCIDLGRWEAPPPGLSRPVVLHAPSSAEMAGSASIDGALRSLDERGLIRYQRVSGLPPADVQAMVKAADVVVDKCSIGSYGVMAIQAMAAGKVVVGHVHDDVRGLVRSTYGDLPIVETNGRDIAEVLTAICSDPGTYGAVAAEGRDFARRVHSGEETARLLLRWLASG